MKGPAPTVTDPQSNCRPWLATAEQTQLLSRYPLFFRAVSLPDAYPSNMAHFGIQCGFGWYAIVEQLAHEIECELRAMWQDIIDFPLTLALLDQTLLLSRCDSPLVPVCTNISQCAGEMIVDVMDGLVCGLDSWTRIRRSIEKAKAKSREICESCGKPGQYREGHWHHVYCDECAGPIAASQADSSICTDDGNGLDAPDRLLAARLLRFATLVWDDAADADAWMRCPHPELGGTTPYEAAADPAGAAQVEAILGRILHGIPT
ncbi:MULTISPECIES: antitoxin Xre/MbcA/ParS toxin-binding domain-containing protein [unclassified Paraburkholderia]|uniref:antitoxin Xre/MbcA/ParS toxin-binding domain-containing protein n=1 Tax=Paraburkholderia TaxID=1822464 RepID=UPI0034CD5F2B